MKKRIGIFLVLCLVVASVFQEQVEGETKGQANIPICQSCAMPMENNDLFGINADGSKSEEFCTYCFKNGKFTEPDIAMQEMIDKCVGIMAQQGIMPEKQARDLMAKTIPTLKRWNTK